MTKSVAPAGGLSILPASGPDHAKTWRRLPDPFVSGGVAQARCPSEREKPGSAGLAVRDGPWVRIWSAFGSIVMSEM